MLDPAVSTPATYRRIRRALEAAVDGESTVLRCSTELPGPQALAYADQHRLATGAGKTVAVTLRSGCLHITPVARTLRPSPVKLERRSLHDRRIGERRKRGSDDPVERLFLSINGERRSGTDRRSGEDRRAARPAAVRVRRR
jgi:hypothetical protein